MDVSPLNFDLPVPSAWELRVQATFIVPAESPDPDLPPTSEQVPRPRANLVVNRTATTEPDAMTACEVFAESTAGSVAGLQVLSRPAAFAFDDRAVGVATTLAFPATERIDLKQLHVFRIDAGILTQIVATVDALDVARLEELGRVIAGFRPSTGPR